MSFWSTVKKGFGLGLGGSIGGNLGNLIWRWVSRLVGWVMLAAGVSCGAPYLADSVGAYNDYATSHPVQKAGQH